MMHMIMNQPINLEEIKSAFEVFDTEKKGYIEAGRLKSVTLMKPANIHLINYVLFYMHKFIYKK